MSKLGPLDKETMVKHLRELNKLSLKANSKHSENIQKQIDHTIVLAKFLAEDRAKIERLNNVIDIKQREIDELNSKNTDLLWDLSKLQIKMGKMEQDKENNDKKKAQYEKIETHFYKNESVDN
jgi:hypothetical protein